MDRVTEALIKAYKQVSVGDPLDPATLMGPLTDEASVTRFEAAIASAVGEGGEILTGGNRLDRPGSFVEPTIIKVKNEYAIVHLHHLLQ
jgi:aldehyde dehydrogenase (NAD+)